MRQPNSFAVRYHFRQWLRVTALCYAGAASAQTISVDNSPGYNLAPTGAAIVLNSLSRNGTFRTANGNITSCAGAGSGGAGSNAFVIDSAGPYPFTQTPGVTAISWNSATGAATVRTGGAAVVACNTSGTGPAPRIDTFTANPAAPATSASMTLTWTTTNATSCLPTGGSGTIWNAFGILQANGSRQFNAPSSPATTAFTLTCSGNGQQTSRTINVIVGGGGGGGGICAPLYTNTTVIPWNTVFNTWPGFGVRRRIIVPFDGAMAFEFTATSSSTQFGTFATADYPGDGDGNGQMSISRDPGCFTPSQLEPNCLSAVFRYTSIGWSNGPSAFSCKLTPGQRYYLNVTYGATAVETTSVPSCPGAATPGFNCGADMQNQIQD